MVKPCNLGLTFRKHSKVHEKTVRRLIYFCLTPGAALVPCAWSWSLPGLHYRHSHASLADPDLALLTWLPSLTSGLCHHSTLPWWWLHYSADPGYHPQTYPSCYGAVGLYPWLVRSWLQPITPAPGSPLAQQSLLQLPNKRLPRGEIKNKGHLLSGPILLVLTC